MHLQMEEQLKNINKNQRQQTIQNSFNNHYQLQHQNGFDKRLGKMQVLIICGKLFYHIPQPYMAIFTIILTLSFQFIMLIYVFDGLHFYIGLLLCIYILYLQISLMLSDPGVGFIRYQQFQQHLDIQECNKQCSHLPSLTQEYPYFCNICMTPATKQTYHCTSCEVCIYNFDHHCIFVGKCIGGRNIFKFKLFLFLIFSTLVYGMCIALMIAKQQQIKSIK